MPTDTNQPNQAQIQPVVLIICDGWGVAPPSDGNAITQAKLPVFNRLLKTYPAMTIIASGNEVGLEWGQMGNSEVGHLNIGAGRVYYQTLLRINQSISSGAFFKDETLLKATAHVKKNKSRLHLMGMVSNGNVHSAEEHLYALLKFAAEQKIKEVYIHMFLDGRDALFNGGGASLERLQAKIKEYGVGRVASLAGRFYALDRDNRWDRIEKTYRAIAEGTGEQSSDPAEAIKASYAKEVYDEQFVPVTITDGGKPVATVEDNDAVIFFNFRPDRARELTKAFALPGFDKFTARAYKNLLFVTMAEFEKSLPVEVVFPPDVIKNCLAEVVSNAGLKQFHVAETEKYAHITFFLNGTVEEPFPGEERVIIPSPHVSGYDQKPEMSAPEIAKEVLKAIEKGAYGLVAINFANADMVGHTGNLPAAVKGLEVIDKALGQITDLALAKGYVAVFTAEHGNVEEMINLKTGGIDKEHSTYPVPLIIIGKQWEGQTGPGGDAMGGDLSLSAPVGMLADVAPTILKIMGLEQPPEMTGQSLI